MSKVRPVGFDEFLVLLGAAQAQHESSGEPIPSMWPDNEDRIKSCLLSPFHTFGSNF